MVGFAVVGLGMGRGGGGRPSPLCNIVVNQVWGNGRALTAKATCELVQKVGTHIYMNQTTIYHATSPQYSSMAEFMLKRLDSSGEECKICNVHYS